MAVDPARTMHLLWRGSTPPASGRGPRPSLTVDEIVDAAIGLADAEGLEAVTMRQVAHAVDVSPMTLYTYVPGKVELLDLMFDTVLGRMARTDPDGGHWRVRLTAIAHDNRTLYEQHPWLAHISLGRPPLGPGLVAKYDHELTALDGLGLDAVEMDAALTFLLGFVHGSARAAADVRAERRESAMSDDEWWAVNEPLLAQVLDPARFPTAARVGTAAGEALGAAYNADHAYAFGLARVLDGLAALIER